MVLPIIAYGSKVLRKSCDEIDSSHVDLDVLIKNMFETMYAASGVGLAAPQINKSLRLFAEMKLPGKAWLRFETKKNNDHQTTLYQTAFFAPRGLAGIAYWYLLYPIHKLIFKGMSEKLKLSIELSR